MDDHIICKLCGEKVKRIYGKHLKFSHDVISSSKYKEMFPGAPLQTMSDKKAVSKNSGKFMKEDKWRKWASERIKGDKNPMHRSKKSLQERKENSPFSKEFYKKRNLSENDRKKFIKNALKDMEYNTRTDYWIKRGYSEKEAIKIISKRQTTFSLKICIEKYGEEKGLKRWAERQKKWLNNYKRNNYSKISQILFHEIYDIVKKDFDKIYYATLGKEGINNEYKLELNNKMIMPDFFILDNKKIIEFDGTYWHRKTPENIKRDAERDKIIISNNYEVLHINEFDYHKNPSQTIKNCIDFLYEKNS